MLVNDKITSPNTSLNVFNHRRLVSVKVLLPRCPYFRFSRLQVGKLSGYFIWRRARRKINFSFQSEDINSSLNRVRFHLLATPADDAMFNLNL